MTTQTFTSAATRARLEKLKKALRANTPGTEAVAGSSSKSLVSEQLMHLENLPKLDTRWLPASSDHEQTSSQKMLRPPNVYPSPSPSPDHLSPTSPMDHHSPKPPHSPHSPRGLLPLSGTPGAHLPPLTLASPRPPQSPSGTGSSARDYFGLGSRATKASNLTRSSPRAQTGAPEIFGQRGGSAFLRKGQMTSNGKRKGAKVIKSADTSALELPAPEAIIEKTQGLVSEVATIVEGMVLEDARSTRDDISPDGSLMRNKNARGGDKASKLEINDGSNRAVSPSTSSMSVNENVEKKSNNDGSQRPQEYPAGGAFSAYPSCRRTRAATLHRSAAFRYKLQDFVLERCLGQGAFAKVYLVKPKDSHKIFALKSMRKDKLVELKQVAHVMNERKVMGELKNDFLVELHATFQDGKRLFMIMEYMNGGDLFRQIRLKGKFTNDEAVFYASEIAMALSFLHSQNIFYRDLKLENVLLDSTGHVKLGDFGFAKRIVDGGVTRSFCGTPSYMPPEIIRRQAYTSAVDWWSFGVLIFEMLSGCSPYQDETCSRTYERILCNKIYWPDGVEYTKCFSLSARDIIDKLLVLDPNRRLGANDELEIRDHPWFKDVDWKAVKTRTTTPPIPLLGLNALRRASSAGMDKGKGEASTEFERSAFRSNSWTPGGNTGDGMVDTMDLFKEF